MSTDITGVSKIGCVAAMSLITPVSLLGAYQICKKYLFIIFESIMK